MTPNQLPPLPDGVALEDLLIPLRAALNTCHDTDWSLRQFKTHISHALAALVQQAQEPVARIETPMYPEGGGRYRAEVTLTRELPLYASLYTTPQPAQQAQECTRSHPHELMSPMCELRTEIARLTNENERLKRAQQAQPQTIKEHEKDCATCAHQNLPAFSNKCQKCSRLATGARGNWQAQVPAPVDEREAWLPIEAAPEDMPECVAVRWKDSEGNECRDLDYMEDDCWMHWHYRAEHVEMIGGHGVSYRPPYEHYMPLPPAPQTKGQP